MTEGEKVHEGGVEGESGDETVENATRTMPTAQSSSEDHRRQQQQEEGVDDVD